MYTVNQSPPNNFRDQPQEKKWLGFWSKLLIGLVVVVIFLAAVGQGFMQGLINAAEKLAPDPAAKTASANSGDGFVPHDGPDSRAQVPSQDTLHGFLESPADKVLKNMFWASFAGILVSTPFYVVNHFASNSKEAKIPENTKTDPDDE